MGENARMTHPRGMNPDARALFWFMQYVQGAAVDIRSAAWESGVPEKSIYDAIQRYPDVFRLDGPRVAWAFRSRPPGAKEAHGNVGEAKE